MAWQCLDGTVGTFALRKYNLGCESYTFSSSLMSAQPCGQYASATLAEGYTNYGWCVSCLVPGNCPGAWAQVDLGVAGNVGGIVVAGRNYFCNYPLTLTMQYSLDGTTWAPVDGGYVFSTGLTTDSACARNDITYNIYRPQKTLAFSQPIMARYLRVFPLAYSGMNNEFHPLAAMSCMTFEPLAVSEAASSLLLMYSFTSADTWFRNWGAWGSAFNLGGPGTWSQAGSLVVGGGKVVTSPELDFSQVSEFTLTYWLSYQSYSCTPTMMAVGLLDDQGKWLFGAAPCYGTSFMKVTVGGTNTVNGFGWGQNVYGNNLQIVHGRRAGSTNYFWVGQRGGMAYTSNGMSSMYEFFNLPRWPSRVKLSIGSAGHPHIITVRDIRLYRDLSITGSDPGLTGQVPFDTAPSSVFPPSLNYCAICQPGFYCNGNQRYSCPPYSSAGYQATALSQCICYSGMYKDPISGCRACRAGYYCPNQNTELACTVTQCPGFAYESAACTNVTDRVCSPCPSSLTATSTPAVCVCPANSYNNGTGCSACPANSVSSLNSFGLGSCSCLAGYVSVVSTNTSNTNQVIGLVCNECDSQSYSIAGTRVCFPIPPNTTANGTSGYICPAKTFLTKSAPVQINGSGYPLRPGLLYWSFDDNTTGLMNEWGNYTPPYMSSAPKAFPGSTTSDIQATNPNVKCKFGSGCALIGGTTSNVYAYPLTFQPFPMPADGLTVSFWFRINSCASTCNYYAILGGMPFMNFAGVVATHAADTSQKLGLGFVYNGQSVTPGVWNIYATAQYDTQFTIFKNQWHHHMFVFKPGGRFLGYNDGVLLVNTSFGANFPSMVSGTFFTSMYYNAMVDDFAIFQGDVSKYIANFQTKPANQALDTTGIGAACLACHPGMYCYNNSAYVCPTGTMSAGGMASNVSQCLCNASGIYGSGQSSPNCSVPCPANYYCPGGSKEMQACQPNTVSPLGSSSVAQCDCPLPFHWDSNYNCACMPVLQTINATDKSACACAPGYYDHPQPYAITPSIRPEAGCSSTGTPCTYYYAAGAEYGSAYSGAKMFDGNPCTSMFSSSGGAFKVVVDLGNIYYLSKLSFVPGGGCSKTDMYRANNMYINLSMVWGQDSVQIWAANTFDFSTLPTGSTFYNISNINRYFRYLVMYQLASSTTYFNVGEVVLTLTNSSFPCLGCPAGSFCPDNLVANQLPCTAGYYCPGLTVAPIPCGLNFFSYSGASACTACPRNSVTLITNATNYTQCVCGPKFYNVSNMIDPQYQTYSVTIPTAFAADGFVNLPISVLWNGNPLGNAANATYNPPSTLPLSCATTTDGPFILYDLGAVVPISQLSIVPALLGYAYCYVSFWISETGVFQGEHILINAVQCSTPTTCGMYDNTLGYYARFQAAMARYVRFYLNYNGGWTQWWQASVYTCRGDSCYSCITCKPNMYCPGTKVNETYPCPNNTFAATGLNYALPGAAANASQCTCPGNASLIQMPGSSSNNNSSSSTWGCGCNAGFFAQSFLNVSNAHVGWICVACPVNMTSLPGALNYSGCFCARGLLSIPLGKNASAQIPISSPLVPGSISYGGTASSWIPGALWPIIDGIGSTANPNIYPRVACYACWTKPPAYLQFDMRGIVPMTKIVAKYNGVGTTPCQFSLQISTTGNYSGEQITVYACGQTSAAYCPAVTADGNFVASFEVQYARYVRWYTGSNQNNGWQTLLQLSVYGPERAYNCSSCTSNQYCPAQFLNQKVVCPNGTFSLPGASSASQCGCPPNALVRGTECTCNAGYYKQTNSSVALAGWQCTSCGANLSSPEGSTSISQCLCAGGFYPSTLSNPTVCAQCAAGFYCPFPNTGALPCPQQLTSLPGTMGCILPCPAGFYCPGDGQVLPCSSGSYSTGSAGASCILCEVGFFCNTTVQHYPCPPGFFCPSASTQPSPCPSGTYALGNAGAACNQCDTGYYCPTALGRIPCPVLFYCPVASTAPLPCEPGLYSCQGSALCTIPCPPGGYCPGNGTVIPCPLGTFSNGSATFNCTECPQGFFCDMALQLSAAGCV